VTSRVSPALQKSDLGAGGEVRAANSFSSSGERMHVQYCTVICLRYNDLGSLFLDGLRFDNFQTGLKDTMRIGPNKAVSTLFTFTAGRSLIRATQAWVQVRSEPYPIATFSKHKLTLTAGHGSNVSIPAKP
jgi:hypothetical protein